MINNPQTADFSSIMGDPSLQDAFQDLYKVTSKTNDSVGDTRWDTNTCYYEA